jgi:hypothetical protein
MQKRSISILVVFLALITASCSGTNASTSPTATSAVAPVAAPSASVLVFQTPEDAVTAYMQGVAQADPSKILQACAINEMSEKFKFDLYNERLKALMPSQSLAPANSPFYIETNKTQLSAQVLGRVKILVYALLSNEKVDDGSVIANIDTERINNFMKDVDPKKLAGLKVEKTSPPNKALMNSTSYQNNATQNALVYGADESTERVVLFSFVQNYYYVGFTLLRYGDNWKISSQTSALAGTNALGAPTKITVDDFDSKFNSN